MKLSKYSSYSTYARSQKIYTARVWRTSSFLINFMLLAKVEKKDLSILYEHLCRYTLNSVGTAHKKQHIRKVWFPFRRHIYLFQFIYTLKYSLRIKVCCASWCIIYFAESYAKVLSKLFQLVQLSIMAARGLFLFINENVYNIQTYSLHQRFASFCIN